MIDRWAYHAAKHIKQVVPQHAASIAVLTFSLSIVINTILIVLVTIFLSLLIGTFKQAMVIMVAFAVLRIFTGGYHLKSGLHCILVSSLLFVLLSIVTLPTSYCIIFTCMSIILISIYAPSNIDKHSRIPKKYYIWLKIMGGLLVATNLIFLSAPFALASFIQSLSLIRRR